MKTGSSPSYLIRNPHSYCFRMKIPLDLQATISRKELRYSLGTGNLSAAKTKARFMAGQVQLLFRDLRNRCFSKMDLSDSQIQSMLAKFMRRTIKSYDKPMPDKRYIDPEKYYQYENDADALEGTLEILPDIKKDYLAKIHGKNFSEAELEADKLLAEEGIAKSDIDKSSPVYGKLCEGIYRAVVKGIDYHQKNLTGDFSDEFDSVLNSCLVLIDRGHEPNPITPSVDISSPTAQIVTLGQLMDEYVAAHKKKWVPGAVEGFGTTRKLLEQFIGSKTPVHTIKRTTTRQFRDTLGCLPLRFKQSKYRDMSASEVRALDLPVTEVISGARVNSHLSYLTSMLNWAIREKDYITANPAMGIKVEEEKKSYDPFSKSDIEVIFSCDAFNKAKYPYQFWLPILGLYTGARREELCNLYEDDIKKDEDIWYIDIRQNRPDKRIKGKAGSPSERKVPLHPFIIELGFIEYVKTCKGGRLWPELNNKNQSQKYGVYFGKRFNDTVLKKTGIKPTKEQQQQGAGNKTYHSFRHTVITHLINLDLNIIKIKDVVGHEKGYGMTTGTYYHGQPIKKIYDEVISQIDYGIDLAHLRNSKWVKTVLA
ncbi:MAG: site-specific integrase [Desulfobacter sp.]|nr:MAG: site-specific integrase [Desulfobacter sp.]